jgi:hypothetical protein
MNTILDQVTRETAEKIAEQADAHGLSVDEYLRILLGLNRRRTADTSAAEFESDLNAFSDGTEDLSPTTHTYSREDIYFDHD